MIGIGLRIGLFGGGSIDAQAQAHYNRVIADGGVVPAGVSGTNAFFNAVKTIYGTSDITTAVSVGVDAHYLGYKLGAGAGTTLGQAAQKLYSCAGSSGDVVQTTAASQPLLLEHIGANYFYSPQVVGNFISSDLTYEEDNWDVEFSVKGKYSIGTNRVVGTRSIGDGTGVSVGNTSVGLEYTTGGITYSCFASTTNTDDVEYTFRVTRNSSTGAVTFTKNGVTLTTSGSQIAGPLFSTSYIIHISGALGGVQSFLGNINWAKMYSSGSVVRYFNPATYNASTSQTQWTSTTGEVWTINTGTATSGYKGVLVDRTIVQGDGVDDTISVTGLTTIPLVSTYQSKTYYPASIEAKIGFLISTLSGTSGEYGTAASNTRWYSDNAYFIAQFAPSALRSLYYAKFKTNAQDFKINNGTSPTITNRPFSGANCLFLFSDNTITFMNAQYQTFVMSKIEDNPTQVTAMYNYIRSINNNAF